MDLLKQCLYLLSVAFCLMEVHAIPGLAMLGVGTTKGITPGTRRAPTTDRNRGGDVDNDDADDEDDGSFVTQNGFMAATTTTIPDTGCPYTFEKFEQTSHPFGNNITTGTNYDSEEECKHWCLINSFCRGVDFDSNTGTCYYHRQIDTTLITTVDGVTHYRKTDCEPPLKCWSQSATVNSEDDLSITDPASAQTTCHGTCYVSQTHSQTSTSINRGCLSVTDPEMKPENGCGVDKTAQTIVCFCDTPRCNGLSIAALAAQMLYLPLDSDFNDHSGMNRHGDILPGMAAPEFQCLDKAVNCAALFTGSECVGVTSLANTEWGADDEGEFLPTASFAVWFKKVSNSNDVVSPIQGIFGNSVEEAIGASWEIKTSMRKGYAAAGIITEEDDLIDDYPYSRASNDEWHLAVLSYDGIKNISAELFPTLKFYIDSMPTGGNSLREGGRIGVRDQPVGVGCVGGQHFVGFIDEARIFSTVLSMNDIRALKAMRDTNYFW